MERRSVLWFSGSGNSLAVARDIAESIGAKLVSITSESAFDEIRAADHLGFVFPLYDFKPPKFLLKLIKKAGSLQGKYLYAICTYGIAPKNAMPVFSEFVRQQGGVLACGYAVAMPHNGIGSTRNDPTENHVFQQEWERRRTAIGHSLSEKQHVEPDSAPLLPVILSRRVRRMMPSVFRLLGLIMTKGISALTLQSSDACIGCGTCVTLCPVGNIRLTEKKAVWSDDCIGCFRCYHWCPEHAVSPGGFDIDIRHYRHPQVTLRDMVN